MVTDKEWKQAERRGREMLASPTCAVAAIYRPALKRIVVTLRSGLEVAIDPARYQTLQHARPAQLREIEISPLGDALFFPKLDDGLYLPGVFNGLTGTQRWMDEQNKLEGKPRPRRRAA